MCGIIGSFNYKINKNILKLIQHRGPDDRGLYNDNDINLGHTRLAIQDLTKSGYQPMISKCKNYILVYNGEIYNKDELNKILKQKGIYFKGTSDTEILLNLFILYQEKCLNLINGIFAFAIWNKNNKTLFIARDQFGVKPIYFYNRENAFSFSSELSSLINITNNDFTLDTNSFCAYLTHLWVPGPSTIIKNYKKLEPGHFLIIKDSQIIKKKKYYELLNNIENKNLNKKNIIEKTRSLIENSVKKQLISDVKIGSFLSGGVDSTVITTFANKYYSKNFESFTINNTSDGDSYEKEFSDDYKFAKLVSSKLGIKLNTLNVNQETLLKQIDIVSQISDEPTSDPSALNTMLISGFAKNHGFKVLLSGIGGDDIFSGYRRHNAFYYENYWKWLPDEIKYGFKNTISKLKIKNNFIRRLKKIFEYSNLRNNSSINSYFNWINPEILKDISKNGNIFNDFLKEPQLIKELNQIDRSGANISSLNKMLYLELKYFLGDHNLNYTDKVGMSNGVEIRVPFLDKDLVNFVFSLEDKYKIRNFKNKWILKKSMEGIIPNAVLKRSKVGFGLPIRSWIKKDLNEIIQDTLFSNNSISSDFFDHKKLKNLIKLNKDGIIDSSYFIFNIFCLELWAKHFKQKKLIL